MTSSVPPTPPRPVLGPQRTATSRLSIMNPDGTIKTAAELQASANDLIAQAQARGERIRAEMAANVVEVTSRNGAATVTVSATGALDNLRLSDRAKGMSPVQISQSVMDAYREATRQAAARTMEITQAETGDERTVAMMRDLLPDYARPDEEN